MLCCKVQQLATAKFSYVFVSLTLDSLLVLYHKHLAHSNPYDYHNKSQVSNKRFYELHKCARSILIKIKSDFSRMLSCSTSRHIRA